MVDEKCDAKIMMNVHIPIEWPMVGDAVLCPFVPALHFSMSFRWPQKKRYLAAAAASSILAIQYSVSISGSL